MSIFFSNNRQDLRQMYLDAWQKYTDKNILTPLEAQITDIIEQHPEYQKLLSEKHIDNDYLPDVGDTNPFLHMSLHLAIREQVNTNRPAGINNIYQQLCKQFSAHDVEHKMFEILAETLWQAQRDNKAPDENQYLKQQQQLLKT